MLKNMGLKFLKILTGLMVSAIVFSDNLIIQISNMYSKQDIEAATDLANIAEIDVNGLGPKMSKSRNKSW